MRLIILAAGVSSRLHPYTQFIPKTILEFSDGSTIMSRLLDEVKRTKIFQSVIIVCGYKKNTVKKYVKKKYKNNIKLDFAYNKNFESTTPLDTINIIRKRLFEEDFAIINSDSFFEKGTFSKLKKIKNGFTLVIYKKKNYDNDAMKVVLENKKNIIKVNKLI